MRLAALLGLALFIWTLRSLNLSDALEMVASLGFGAVLILLPFGLHLLVDTLGWRILLSNLGRPVGIWPLLRIRTGTEAVLMSVPAGSVIGETLVPALLKRIGGVPIAEGLATVGLRKALFVLSEAPYVTLAALLGFTTMMHGSRAIIGVPGLEWLISASAAFLLFAGFLAVNVLVKGSVAERTHRLLGIIPHQGVRSWLESKRTGFVGTDLHFKEALRLDRHGLYLPLAAYITVWLTEALESWLVLYLLGARLSFGEVLSFDAVMSLVRTLVFFIPGAIGVQDVGYLAFLRAYGVSDANTVGAAFVLVKRLKELFWIGFGYLVLFTLGRAEPEPQEVR